MISLSQLSKEKNRKISTKQSPSSPYSSSSSSSISLILRLIVYLFDRNDSNNINGHLFHLSRFADARHGRDPRGEAFPQVMEGQSFIRDAQGDSGGVRALGDERAHRQRRHWAQQHHLRFLRIPQAHVSGTYKIIVGEFLRYD